MTLHKFTGGTSAVASEVNDNIAEAMLAQCKNHVRQLIDRTGVYSADGTDLWGEVFPSNTGRNASVNANTTAKYDSSTLSYYPTITDEAAGDTLHDPSSFTNPTNAFDGDGTTAATKNSVSSTTVYLGKTFSAKTVEFLYVRAFFNFNSGTTTSNSLKIQTYNGSTWSDFNTVASFSYGSNQQIYGVVDMSSAGSIQGIRAAFVCGSTWNVGLYLLEYGDMAESIIGCDIPSGTFGTAISNAICGTILTDWESGANVQFRLLNTGGDDSGWLEADDVVQAFTAFSSGEPDEVQIKLIQKTSSPTPGYPSIRGFAVRCT